MNDNTDSSKSVGLVQTQHLKIPLSSNGLSLKKGGFLHDLTVAYEAYGRLNEAGDNVVYICTALTGDAHVAGYHDSNDPKPGWWDQMVGPGKGIDTDYYYVVCANILGGCMGTTGPCSINPETNKPYGSSFPEITVTDIVNVQKILLDQLGVHRLAAVVGGSFGGMQVLEWSIRYPEFVERCICIATGMSLSAQALAFDVVACDAITSDPNWAGGNYYNGANKPEWGLSHARKIGHITYLSPEIMQKKFGREKTSGEEGSEGSGLFQVESYLNYQGKKLVDRFDANTYLQITRAMDGYDLCEEFGSLENAFSKVKSKFLVVALSSDWLFPPEQSFELANALLRAGKHVSFCTLGAPYGHDAFLIDIEHLAEAVRAFLPWIGRVSDNIKQPETAEFNVITNRIRQGARVLDLGCGNGNLLSLLSSLKGTIGVGVDKDLRNVIDVINRGHDVYQGNLDDELSLFPDHSYDYAILSSTIQQVSNPQAVLHEMTRIAAEGIVTFPNFANWRNRMVFGLSGRMPKNEALPYEWYNTPNIHLATRNDFIDLCRNEGLKILELVCLPADGWFDRLLLSLNYCNLGAMRVIARITRA